MIDGLAFGVYFLLLLFAFGFLLSEVAYRAARRCNIYQSKNVIRLLVFGCIAIQGALAGAWPVASSLAGWAVSSGAHSAVGSFLFDLIMTHRTGIALGVLGTVFGVPLWQWLMKHRARLLRFLRNDDEVISGQ